MPSASYRFVVTGIVQGVYFRQSAKQTADTLNLQGWVRNRPDGRVEGYASGDEAALERFRAWLLHGPERAVVNNLEWEPVEAQEFCTGFVVHR